MPAMHRRHPHVTAIMEETGEADPVRAIRAKSRALVREFVSTFGGDPPFDLEALASFRGLVVSQDMPRHSPDSEIAPEGDRVVMRVNRERPLVRQRFSIGHEIGHTLFPEYRLAVRCRKPTNQDWADANDLLESLCDVAASEILFPSPWFDDAVATKPLSAEGVLDLANRFAASLEATIRRLIDLNDRPIAALFCSWKLKPVELRSAAADRHQQFMFDGGAPVPTAKLRVDYSIMSELFRSACGVHLPKDKSITFEGPIARAAQTQHPCDGALRLDLGTMAREFDTHVIPVYTPEDRVGPNGEPSVVVIIAPRKIQP